MSARGGATAVAMTVLSASAAFAETETFDQANVGAAPAGWACGVTGKGSPRWTVDADPSAPSGPNVLRQSGSGTFPWCMKSGTSVADGFVEVKFKPEKGQQDQAGGVIWRGKDGDNYYIARANALEDNVSLYYTAKGKRNTIKYVNAPVPRNVWHSLRVEFSGKRIKVVLDGKTYIEEQDEHLSGSGMVGLWTKADSVTAFDDFAFGAAK